MFDRNRNVRHETTDRFIFSIMSKVVYSLMNIHVRDMMSVFLQIYFRTLHSIVQCYILEQKLLHVSLTLIDIFLFIML